MKNISIILISLLLCLSSCDWRMVNLWCNDSNKELRISRYDRLLDEFVSLNSVSALQRMNTEYPQATRMLIEDVLLLGDVQDSDIYLSLRMYFLDSTMQVLLEAVHNEYRSLDQEEKELGKIFNKIKEYDPEFVIPAVYTQISGLNQSIVVSDSLLGISLDKYLGVDFPVYKKYYYTYQRRQMERSRIVSDASFFYLSSEYSVRGKKVFTFLDHIIDYGKITWVIANIREHSLCREANIDTAREKWYRSHEAEVWKWIGENDILFTSDLTLIRDFTSSREGTPIFGDDAPDQIGLWLGLRIVESYMKNNPDVKPFDLLRTTDYETILKKSGFKPGR